ncbi:LOW QUALITY PROTEIN: hypothetical protein PanWU01x14_010060 [Parasponia andersonii]|uniref:Uncharacterized protein n=1 Tax=Parasponia andersonii TaxID=3476 RepID=A0A2P5E2K2_PARAD|nr:LOW QUALITY PROTEIN: hypothetical protein PanWU01x14_010060 [Parasponia andersonii]
MGVGKEYLGMELKKSQKRKTCKGGPGCHPGMARRAFAGFMEAGSIVVATSSVTISLSLSLSPLTVLLNLADEEEWRLFTLQGALPPTGALGCQDGWGAPGIYHESHCTTRRLSQKNERAKL